MKDKNQRSSVEELSSVVVDCGYRLHVGVGPGLLESVYEALLVEMLKEKGLSVRRQVVVPIQWKGTRLEEGFRVDILIENAFLVELKSVEKLIPIHFKQVLTYLRLLALPIGLLINYGAPTFKEGIHRIVNEHQNFAASRLRVNQKQDTQQIICAR